MRIAVITDVHGNTPALDAVLADARRAGADRFWLLGDLVAMGPDPAGTVRRLQALNAEVVVMGNTDRHVLRDEGPIPSPADVEANTEVIEETREEAASIAWTKGALSASGHLGWLEGGRSTQRSTLPDGTAVLAVHATAHGDSGPGISPDLDDRELADLFADTAEALVFGGHTHDPTDRTIDGRRFVNPGSVSNHPDADKRARYALLDASETGHDIELRAVDYDVAVAIDMIDASGMPGRTALIDQFFR